VISARNVVALRDPRQWRVRAERIRIVADSVNDPGRRRSMLGIADRYERVGKFIEQQQRDLLKLPPALSTRARAQQTRAVPFPRAPLAPAGCHSQEASPG
jgi:hypothetical protein